MNANITPTIEDIQQEIIDEFAVFDNWMDKYQYLVDLGKLLQDFPEAEENDSNLIGGCQSQVWLIADYHNGTVNYRAKSDAIIVKGIVALLIRVLSGRTTDEIIGCDLKFINEIGLKEHLSPTRSNGLLSMVKQMKFYAMAFKSKFEK